MNTVNTMDPETQLPEVQDMIYKLSWRFATTYPIPYEEALSEAYVAFMRACQDYKPERGQKFSSWCYYWIWCKLKDLVMKRTVEPEQIEINEEMLGECPSGKPEILELIEELSDDAKELASLLLETPPEILEGIRTPRQILSKVRAYLSLQGREGANIDNAVIELRQCLKAVV